MKIATVISNEIKNVFRNIKSYTFGKNVETANFIGPGCIDFNPVKNMKPIYSQTSNNSEPIVIGYMLKSAIDDIQSGDAAFFSIDDTEVPKAIIKARKNGNLELNGNSDFLARFSVIEEAYNKTNDKLNDLIQKYNTHVHPGVTSGSSSTLVTTTIETQSDGDISGAKIDNILTN